MTRVSRLVEVTVPSIVFSFPDWEEEESSWQYAGRLIKVEANRTQQASGNTRFNIIFSFPCCRTGCEASASQQLYEHRAIGTLRPSVQHPTFGIYILHTINWEMSRHRATFAEARCRFGELVSESFLSPLHSLRETMFKAISTCNLCDGCLLRSAMSWQVASLVVFLTKAISAGFWLAMDLADPFGRTDIG
jgi:hypothetical protein